MSAKSPRLVRTGGHDPFEAGRASALRHRDVDAADLALGGDLHRLLGAVGAQCQVQSLAVHAVRLAKRSCQGPPLDSLCVCVFLAEKADRTDAALQQVSSKT